MKNFFTLKDGKSRIANIPYDEYLTVPPAENYILPRGISEDETAENNSLAIQNAINSAKKTNGTVFIPNGRYNITFLKMKSGVTLYLSRNATLVSVDFEKYNALSKKERAIISANGAENFCITGGGTIEGKGLSFTKEPMCSTPLLPLSKFNLYTRVIEARKRIRMAKAPEKERPYMILLKNCKNAVINSIRLKDSACWTCVLSNCFDCKIENLVIDNHLHIANADGIDITGGKDIAVKHCFIATADDAVCIKSSDSNVSDITVCDILATSFANCFKIGTETEFDIKNITVQNCFFFMPENITGGYAGIAVESADGANISDVTVKNIMLDGISSPALVWLGNRLRRGRAKTGSMKNILIENIEAKNAELPCAITGCRDENVKNVVFKNFSIAYRNTNESLEIKENVSDYSMNDYPEITRVSHRFNRTHEESEYYSLPCFGVYIRFAEDVVIENFKCKPRSVNTLSELKVEENADVKTFNVS